MRSDLPPLVGPPQHTLGLRLFRIGIGSVLLYYYVIGWTIRLELWGPHGVLPRRLYWSVAGNLPGYSFLGLPQGEFAFSVLYAIGAIVVVAWLVCPTRALSFAVVVAGLGLLNRNPLMLSGGDHLIQIALFTMPLFDFRAASETNEAQSTSSTHLTVVHNFALRFLLLQLAITYVSAALYKLSGPVWLKGDALSTILRVPAFDTGFPKLGLTTHAGSALGGYVTIILELLFPLALLSRRWRVPIVAGLAAMHLGIAMMMGLVVFGVTMISFLCLTLDNSTLTRLSLGRGRRPWPRANAGKPHRARDAQRAQPDHRPASSTGPATA